MTSLTTIRDHLNDIPQAHAALLLRLTPGRTGSGIHVQPHSTPPLRLDVLDAISSKPKPGANSDDPAGERELDMMVGEADCHGNIPREHRQSVLWELAQWSRMADAEMHEAGVEHVDTADEPTVTTEAGWLAMHLDWIGTQPWYPEFAADVTRIHRRLTHLLGERPPYRPSCACGGRVSGQYPDDNGVPSYWMCDACSKQYLRKAAAEALENTKPPMTLNAIGITLNIPTSTLYLWRDKHVIHAVHGKTLMFSLDAVRDAAAKLSHPATRKGTLS